MKLLMIACAVTIAVMIPSISFAQLTAERLEGLCNGRDMQGNIIEDGTQRFYLEFACVSFFRGFIDGMVLHNIITEGMAPTAAKDFRECYSQFTVDILRKSSMLYFELHPEIRKETVGYAVGMVVVSTCKR